MISHAPGFFSGFAILCFASASLTKGVIPPGNPSNAPPRFHAEGHFIYEAMRGTEVHNGAKGTFKVDVQSPQWRIQMFPVADKGRIVSREYFNDMRRLGSVIRMDMQDTQEPKAETLVTIYPPGIPPFDASFSLPLWIAFVFGPSWKSENHSMVPDFLTMSGAPTTNITLRPVLHFESLAATGFPSEILFYEKRGSKAETPKEVLRGRYSVQSWTTNHNFVFPQSMMLETFTPGPTWESPRVSVRLKMTSDKIAPESEISIAPDDLEGKLVWYQDKRSGSGSEGGVSRGGLNGFANSSQTPRHLDKPAAEQLYDVKADGKEQIKRALETARAGNQRIILKFGANWCGWCQKLSGLFKTNAEIASILKEDYQLVLIDVDQGHNADVVKQYGNPTTHGLPVLVVLDSDGKLLTTKNTAEFEEGTNHSPGKVLAFLQKWRKQ
jgi:hypothetical protein